MIYLKLVRSLAIAAVGCSLYSLGSAQPVAGTAPTSGASTKPPSTSAPDATFAAVKARGFVKCGVMGLSPGFSLPDSKGEMRGIDAEVCRAVATALFGNPTKVEYVTFAISQRITALQAGEVDIVAANLTWTLLREAQAGLVFPAVHYYDGTTFMVNKKSKVSSSAKLSGASVCVKSGSAEGVLQDYSRQSKLKFKPVVFSDGAEMEKAFLAGRCDAILSDASALASFRYGLGANAQNYDLLPEFLSKEPLGMAVRKGDGKWFDLVRYSFYAMVNAEELGITSKNVDEFMNSPSPVVRRLLGAEGDIGAALGVDNKWAVNIIKNVGNYGEMWQRNFGPSGVPRGLNRLWNSGGLQMSPPFR